MEFDGTKLRAWMEETFAPVVLVRTTADVEDCCFKNNLTFLELIRPHEKLKKEVYVRTTKEFDTFALNNFRVRFRTLEELERLPMDQMEQFFGFFVRDHLLSKHRQKSAPSSPTTIITIPPASPTHLRFSDRASAESTIAMFRSGAGAGETTATFTPWFEQWREQFPLALRCSDFETFEHPVACMSVVSSKNSDPIRTLKELYDPENPPPIFPEREMDPQVLMTYVLLHDQQDGGSREKVELIFRKMKETFGASNCRLLRINSRDPKDIASALPIDIWTQHTPAYEVFLKQYLKNQLNNAQQSSSSSSSLLATTASKPVVDFDDSSAPVLGTHMTQEDLNFIADFLVEFIGNGVIPHMERKIRTINAIAMEKKKGIKNKLFAYFKPKQDKSTDSLDQSRFGAKSVEFQIRRMADHAFMFHDYEVALATYRVVSSDFKNSKQAAKQYASVSEMIGICTVLTGGSRREAESSLDTAVTQYARCKESLFAIRASLFLSCVYKAHNELRKAAETYTRASTFEESSFFISALMLEQTAFCYLLMVPSMFRKFSLFLVLAGYRYSHCNQIEHSFRCYKTVLSVYETRHWEQIEEHLSITLGRLSIFLNNIEDSVGYFHEFMCRCQQPPEKQVTFLKEFLSVVRAHTNERLQKSPPTTVEGTLAAGTTAGLNKLPLVNNSNHETADTSMCIQNLGLPRVEDETFRVLLSEYERTQSGTNLPANASVGALFGSGSVAVTDAARQEHLWKEMEEHLMQNIRPDNVRQWARKFTHHAHKSQISVVGEPIFVEFRVENTLQISIEITDMHLTASFNRISPSPMTTTAAAETTTTPMSAPNLLESEHHLRHANHPPTQSASSEDDLYIHPSHRANSKLSSIPPSSSMPILCTSLQSDMSSSSSDNISGSAQSLASVEEESPSTPHLSTMLQQPASTSLSVVHSSVDAEVADRPLFEVEPLNVVLGPRERRLIRLQITPFYEGDLHIRGLRWSVCNIVCGHRLFSLRGKKLNRTKQQRMGSSHESDTRLHVKVTRQMPLLGARLINMPQMLWHGEYRRAILEISNAARPVHSANAKTSSAAGQGLKNLKLMMSHPALFTVGRSGDTSTPFLPFMDDSAADGSVFVAQGTEQAVQVDESMTRDPSVVPLRFVDGMETLQHGESLQIPLYVRGTTMDAHDAMLLFYYESDIPNKDMEFRLHRMSLDLKVIPSLHIRTFVQPSQIDPNESLLGMEIKNQRVKDVVHVDQISSLSPSWQLHPIVPCDKDNHAATQQSDTTFLRYTIEPGESTTLHFKICKSHQQGDSQETDVCAPSPPGSTAGQNSQQQQAEVEATHHRVSTPRSSLRLFPTHHSPNAKVLNITRSPFVDFLFRENAPSLLDKRRDVETIIDIAGVPVAIRSVNGDEDLFSAISVGSVGTKRRSLTQRFPFLRSDGIALSLLWHSADRLQCGQCNTTDVSFLPIETQAPPVDAPQLPSSARTLGVSLAKFLRRRSLPSSPSDFCTTDSPPISPVSPAIRGGKKPPPPPMLPKKYPQLQPQSPQQPQPQMQKQAGDSRHLSLTGTSFCAAECPIKVLVDLPEPVVHDFASCSICEIPVAFRVCNVSSSSVGFTLELLPPSGDLSDGLACFLWAGPTRVQMASLQPGATAQIAVVINVFRSGVYNFDRHRVWLLSAENGRDPVLVASPATGPVQQHLIFVHDRPSV